MRVDRDTFIAGRLAKPTTARLMAVDSAASANPTWALVEELFTIGFAVIVAALSAATDDPLDRDTSRRLASPQPLGLASRAVEDRVVQALQSTVLPGLDHVVDHLTAGHCALSFRRRIPLNQRRSEW
ncbi:hypothetical protein [Burkholderia vietnamiensis]|uniref:hypothetical protein n=1 Tax=Burkholderia vietnamiensis TaxID=60552 RepID=UPI0020115C99|nr:hypothetical protein [Burkholderia vietnamiensis]